MTLLLSTLLLVTTACGPESEDASSPSESGPDPSTVEVTVSWVPRSTEDEHMNGRSLTLSADGIVRQQGEGAPTTEAMDPQQWEEFVADLPAELEDIEDDGESCTGAGGTTLTVTGAGDLDREVSAMVCGGESPPAAEQIEDLVADFR